MQFFSPSHNFNFINLEYDIDYKSGNNSTQIVYKILTKEPKNSNILDVKTDSQELSTTDIASLLLWSNEELSKSDRELINCI